MNFFTAIKETGYWKRFSRWKYSKVEIEFSSLDVRDIQKNAVRKNYFSWPPAF
jgi:hypothetical protein